MWQWSERYMNIVESVAEMRLNAMISSGDSLENEAELCLDEVPF
jgi:hypothetical protein